MNTKPKWDTFYSTYFWRVYLDKRHPDNSQEVEFLTGYSKRIGQREASDKAHMLKVKIINLFNNGYFKKMIKWEIQARTGEVIDHKRDPIIMVLTPTGYTFPGANTDLMWKLHGKFLDEFYSRIRANKSMDGLLPNARKGMDSDKHLDPSLRNHPSVDHLYSYASRLSRFGHPSGAVTAYINEVKLLKRWD